MRVSRLWDAAANKLNRQARKNGLAFPEDSFAKVSAGVRIWTDRYVAVPVTADSHPVLLHRSSDESSAQTLHLCSDTASVRTYAERLLCLIRIVNIGKIRKSALPPSLGSMATWSAENYCEPFVGQGVYRGR